MAYRQAVAYKEAREEASFVIHRYYESREWAYTSVAYRQEVAYKTVAYKTVASTSVACRQEVVYKTVAYKTVAYRQAWPRMPWQGMTHPYMRQLCVCDMSEHPLMPVSASP